MRRMSTCVPHSGRYPDHAGGRRQDRRGLKPEPLGPPRETTRQSSVSRPETTLSVTLATHATVLSSARLRVTSAQPFAKFGVLRARGPHRRYLVMYQSYGMSIACNEAGCR